MDEDDSGQMDEDGPGIGPDLAFVLVREFAAQFDIERFFQTWHELARECEKPGTELCSD